MRGYLLDHSAYIEYHFSSGSDYENWLKARALWKSTPLLLTLIYKNELAVNAFQYSTFAAPTTLIDWTGYIGNFVEPVDNAEVVVRGNFFLATNIL